MIEDEVRAAFSRCDAGDIDLHRLRRRITQESAQRRKRRGWGRAGIAAAVAALALAAAPALVNNTAELAPGTDGTVAGPVNVLLLGTGDQGRSDGIVLVHVNAARSKVYLYSVPLDSLVDLPDGMPGRLGDLGNGIQPWVNKHFGVGLDAVATMDVAGLERIVESLGEIEVCIDGRAYSAITAPGVVRLGACPRLTGAEVGDLVRMRESMPYGSTARDRNVQRVLIGLLTEINKTVTNPGKLHDLLGTARISVSGDLPMAELVWQLRGLQPSDVVGVSRPGFASIDDDELVRALRNDHMDRFVASHPDWVTRLGP